MALAGEYEEVKALIGMDQCFSHTERTGVVHVVVDVTGRQEQVSFQVRREIGVLLDVVFEGDVAFIVDDFLETVVCLRPVTVRDVVVVVAG